MNIESQKQQSNDPIKDKSQNGPIQDTDSKSDNEQCSTLNSSSHLSQLSNNSNQLQIQRHYSATEDFFLHVLEEQQENIKIFTGNDWKNLIKGTEKKYVSKIDLKANFRAGIKSEFRPQIWFWMCETRKMESRHDSDFYFKLSSAQCKQEVIILQDVKRTQGSDQRKGQVQRIARAYVNYDPEIGYTQGMNEVISGILCGLEVLQTKFKKTTEYVEQKGFWILIYMCFEHSWREIYRAPLVKAQTGVKRLDDQIKEKVPEVYHHMKNSGIDTFIAFFKNIITINMSYTTDSAKVRILDLFLLEGENSVYQIIIRFLQLCREEILQCEDINLLNQFLQKDLINYCTDKFKDMEKKLVPLPQSEIINTKYNQGRDIEEEEQQYEQQQQQ